MKKPKTITAYRHPPLALGTEQAPDAKPGNYYVSVRDNDRTGLLLGPFKDNHAAALAYVEPVRARAAEVNFRAVWYGFGTLRMAAGFTRPGTFNAEFPEAFAEAA